MALPRARCTCPWYLKHQADRGPCKHVLAVQLTYAPSPADLKG
ncbi:MAG: SWIM zinc finger family protein [Bifidobacteriaceae bacterium]|nr:SWIM zinc finger family protein [Bifidobacteriaceae bacterium]